MADNLAWCTFIRVLFVVVAVVVITTIWSRRFDGATACSWMGYQNGHVKGSRPIVAVNRSHMLELFTASKQKKEKKNKSTVPCCRSANGITEPHIAIISFNCKQKYKTRCIIVAFALNVWNFDHFRKWNIESMLNIYIFRLRYTICTARKRADNRVGCRLN